VAAGQVPAAPAVTGGREFTEGIVPPANPSPATAAPAAPALAQKSAAGSSQSSGNPQSSIPQSGAGRLLVRSTPAGARVFVDGREQGKSPLTVGELARGVHRVRVVREGYATEERRVTITSSRPQQSMTVPLTRARVARTRESEPRVPVPSTPGTVGRFVGPLTVISRPPGARVFVDGKPVGTTPLQLPSLNAGSHAVRIELDGYRPWSSSVRVVASESNRVTASLEK
jgi:hypothetical protein